MEKGVVALPLKLGFQFGSRAFGFGKIGLIPASCLHKLPADQPR